MKQSFIILLIIIALGYGVYYFNNNTSMTNTNAEPAGVALSAADGNQTATIETSAGIIKVELLGGDAPKTVANFTTLAKKGFYDGVSFHRVIPGFMIQGGDPNCGKNGGADSGFCGGGDAGYKFNDEINASSALYKTGYKKGILAMANSGPNTNGSQFFIMVSDYPLPPNYTIFGRVLSGQDVADAISNVKRNSSDRPLTPVVMKSVTVAQ